MADTDRTGRADLHIHTVASDGLADVVAIVHIRNHDVPDA